MVRYRNYFAENIRRSFGAWERHEAMSTLITLVITALIGLAISTAAAETWRLGDAMQTAIGFTVWFVILFALVTPFRMWKVKVERVEELETKQRKHLRIMAGQSDRYWWTKSGPTIWQVIVKNVSTATSISGVWVTVTFKGAEAENFRWPQTLLSKEQRIDPRQNRPCKIFELVNTVEGLCMRLEVSHGGRPLYLPLGIYQLTIEAGGEDAAAVKYGYTLTLLDSTNLKLVKDYGPPEDDDAPRIKTEKVV